MARKRLGQFYTPQSEAASFATWAVRTGSERILEPSVGDGALLRAALARAQELDHRAAPSVIACDINAETIKSLRPQFGPRIDLFHCDFFELDPASTDPVDVVLANPPFTRNHQLAADARCSLKHRFPQKGAAGLWTYFMLHACRFLKPGGRMAFVVPASATFANYADALIETLSNEFRDLALYDLPTKPAWIGRASERGALLLADGYHAGASSGLRRGLWSYAGSPAEGHISPPPSFNKLLDAARPLSMLAELSIGFVTGSNRTFLLSDADIFDYGLHRDDLARVISRARHAKSVNVEISDLEELGRAGEKTWLLKPRELGPRGGGVRRRLAMISSRERRKTVWLNKRAQWWNVETGPAADAVFTYMNDLGPHLSLVPSGVTCTNTLHRVVFKAETREPDKIAAVLTFISTFGQWFAEGLGRAYGGGVLKFELQEARKFPILPSSGFASPAALMEIDAALRRGDGELARNLADEALIAPLLGPSWRGVTRDMKRILDVARAARRRGEGRHQPKMRP
ncbi:N-6 DNA methylase [Ensifer adhaerens]|uniref:N-6 DNA methylase n=1 Tax=Ensifer adhaerens TaxID=106592 RepID=UPI00156A220F|nr:N-6 DNA methylase [Ensifer adhaerens]